MHRSLSQRLHTLLLAALTAVGASLFAPAVLADTFTAYEPSFLRQAERALRRDAPDRALAIIEESADRVAKNRHRAEAQGLNCRAHLALGAPVDARSACLAAIELDRSRSSWRYLNNLGVAELTLGNYDAAETAFSRAAAISGWAATPRKNLRLLSDVRQAREITGGEQVAAEVRPGAI